MSSIVCFVSVFTSLNLQQDFIFVINWRENLITVATNMYNKI